MTNIEVVLAVVVAMSGAATTYVALVMQPLRDKLDEGKEDRDKLDKRLSEVERSYISRAEHAEFRAEMMAAVRDIGAKIESSLNGLSHRIETLVERMAKVEAAN